ncbi:MAG: hypothetical protein IKM28_06930 [Lachnospiraceae bacterium]|nr:hypothetical protein [Lachnospiraceae bacterium]
MQGVWYDAHRIKVYEYLVALAEYAGQDREWLEKFWADLLTEPKLYEEMVYYLINHDFRDDFKCYGYSLTDLYVWQMSKYNLIRDEGKNTSECNKETLVLRAFRTMLDLKREPEVYLGRLRERRGMDLF